LHHVQSLAFCKALADIEQYNFFGELFARDIIGCGSAYSAGPYDCDFHAMVGFMSGRMFCAANVGGIRKQTFSKPHIECKWL